MKISQLHADNIEQLYDVAVDPDEVTYNREGYDADNGWEHIPDSWLVAGLTESDCRN